MFRKKLFRNKVNHNGLSQKGRTLIEQLAVLALVGVLVIAGLVGFSYARNKVLANQILSDVSLSYAESVSEVRELERYYPVPFKPESNLEMSTVRTRSAWTDFADLIVVEGVRYSVCRILEKQNSDKMTLLEEKEGSFVGFSGCSWGDNRLVFALEGEGTCACPGDSVCELSRGCVCEEGYEVTDAGCEEIVCKAVNQVSEITKEYCCGLVKGVWTQEETCVCEMGYFDGTQCQSDGDFCVYSFASPDMVVIHSDCSYTFTQDATQEYHTDCSYTFTETVLSDDKRLPVMTERESCPTGSYCVLRWKDNKCVSDIPASGASVIYGRCSPYAKNYSFCGDGLNGTMNEYSGCGAYQYCRLTWSSSTCSALSASGAPIIYGVCTMYDDGAAAICPTGG